MNFHSGFPHILCPNNQKAFITLEGTEENDVMSKSEHLANQQKTSRMSKRGTLTQSNQKLLQSKSPKPNNLSKISDDKQKSGDGLNYKSIFLATAEFLLKYNAFTVSILFLFSRGLGFKCWNEKRTRRNWFSEKLYLVDVLIYYV